jgi:hypothetical protein
MTSLKRLVLDLLKPHDPDMREFARATADCPGVDGVNAMLIETDRKVQNIKLTVEGDSVDDEAVFEVIRDLGGTVHSVDEVACGERLIEESQTPQDGS